MKGTPTAFRRQHERVSLALEVKDFITKKKKSQAIKGKMG